MKLSINNNLQTISDEMIISTFANTRYVNNWVANPDHNWGWEYPNSMRSEEEIDNKIYSMLDRMSKGLKLKK